MRERVEYRWQDPDKLLKPAEKSRRELRHRIVHDIAAQRFGFPTSQYPSFRVFLNEPEPTMAIEAGSERLVPDIVVVDSASQNAVRLLANVETVDSLTDERRQQEWLPFSRVADANFFLYVPAGHAGEAKRILKKVGVKRVKLRTWRYITGLDRLDITQVRYGMLGLEALMPPFLLGRR